MEPKQKTNWAKGLAQRWRDWISAADGDRIDIRSVEFGFWHPLWL